MDGRKLSHELFGLFLMFFALLLLLSLCSFNSADPSLNHVSSVSAKVHNKAGLFGAYLAGFLNDVFGVAAFAWPVCLGGLGAGFISLRFDICWWRWCGYVLLALCLLASGAAWNFHIGDVKGGGVLGQQIYDASSMYLNPVGSGLLFLFVLLIATQLSFDISWMTLAGRAVKICREAIATGTKKSWHVPRWDTLRQRMLSAWGALLTKIRSRRLKHEALPVPVEPTAQPADFEPLERHFVAFDAMPLPHSSDDARSERPIGVVVALDEDPTLLPAATNVPAALSLETAMPENSGVPTTEEAQATISPEAQQAAEDGIVAIRMLTPAAASSDTVMTEGVVTATPEGYPVEEAPATAGLEAHQAAEGTCEPVADGMLSESAVTVMAAEDVELIYTESGAVVPRAGLENAAAHQEDEPEGLVAMLTRGTRKVPIPFPPVDLLAQAVPAKPSDENREERGRRLVQCLSEFGVDGALERITPGPVVTMYEYKPAAGVRVRRIENLVDDVARALCAKSIRIQAPIPGQDTVGIEIPNEERELVNFREILCNATFTQASSPLTMVIGKDIAGRPFTADLAVMPHLLVAGATGAGKSVCVNAIIMSFLYKARPEDLQLLLVDPKRVEMAVYADLPHLVHPVVTEMDHAKAALDWAVHEMEQRYTAMAALQVRNVHGYNEKLRKLAGELPPELAGLQPMPYLVIIIDELADLMMTASRREVENSIVRLAQLARAAGIHMILATQRPSVDVVTGLIKANFPCRISFRVSQKVDSRTILDAMGAEALLGKGDMLFKPSGGRILRMHGPFVSDDEVAAVVGYWKRQQKPHYQVDFSEWSAESGAQGTSGAEGESSDDPLYAEVLAFVNEQEKPSISLIQRQFRIGYNRAARLFAELKRDGVVGADGARSRTVPHGS